MGSGTPDSKEKSMLSEKISNDCLVSSLSMKSTVDAALTSSGKDNDNTLLLLGDGLSASTVDGRAEFTS